MLKKDVLENALSQWSYRTNSQKYLIQLAFREEVVFVLHLNGVRAFVNEIFGSKELEKPQVSQVANQFLSLYKKRYPTRKAGLKDFSSKEKNDLAAVLDIISDLNKRYPEAHLTPHRYLWLHFLFYSNNFNTAPKTGYFTTDNAIIRSDKFLQAHDGVWPGDDNVMAYFQNNLSPASPKAKEQKSPLLAEKKPTTDNRLTGFAIFTTDNDKHVSLKDNRKFQAAKARVLNKSASIHEARYVRDCYHLRDSADTMPVQIEDYIEELEDLARTLNAKLR